MGKIRTSGNASIKVAPDMIRYKLIVREKGNTSGEATKKVIIASEALLMELKNTLKDLSKVKFDSDSVSTCDNNGRTAYAAKRFLKMSLPADVKLNNRIAAAIDRANAIVTVDMETSYSKEPEIRKELMAIAVKHSREMAEIIAETQGEKSQESIKSILRSGFMRMSGMSLIPHSDMILAVVPYCWMKLT